MMSQYAGESTDFDCYFVTLLFFFKLLLEHLVLDLDFFASIIQAGFPYIGSHLLLPAFYSYLIC